MAKDSPLPPDVVQRWQRASDFAESGEDGKALVSYDAVLRNVKIESDALRYVAKLVQLGKAKSMLALGRSKDALAVLEDCGHPVTFLKGEPQLFAADFLSALAEAYGTCGRIEEMEAPAMEAIAVVEEAGNLEAAAAIWQGVFVMAADASDWARLLHFVEQAEKWAGGRTATGGDAEQVSLVRDAAADYKKKAMAGLGR